MAILLRTKHNIINIFANALKVHHESQTNKLLQTLAMQYLAIATDRTINNPLDRYFQIGLNSGYHSRDKPYNPKICSAVLLCASFLSFPLVLYVSNTSLYRGDNWKNLGQTGNILNFDTTRGNIFIKTRKFGSNWVLLVCQKF